MNLFRSIKRLFGTAQEVATELSEVPAAIAVVKPSRTTGNAHQRRIARRKISRAHGIAAG